MPAETAFQIVVSVVGALAGSLAALAYFRRVRLERPPIGIFNTRDLSVLAVFIVALPLLYVAVSPGVLTGFIVVTFLSALTITLRPLVRARWMWALVPALLTADILVTHSMHHLGHGLQLYWLLTSAVVMIAAVGISNLYVQGGLELRQIAWFTLFLAVYDIVFTRVYSLTPELAIALQGRPLDPSVGWASGAYNANVGLGDLLVFCLYTVAAYKGFGRRGALSALAIVTVFGAIAPSVTPLLAPGLFGSTAAAFVPVQTLFGPAAFLTYRWLSRGRLPRTTAEWASERGAVPARSAPPARSRAGLAIPAVALAGLLVATLAATGEATTPTAAAQARPTGAQQTLGMRNVAFTPRTITVRAGASVTWINHDRIPHNVVAVSGARFASSTVDADGTFTFRATRPGTIRYVCTFHQGMQGTIHVTG